MNGTEVGQREHSLWNRILGMLEQDLARRRDAKVVVEVSGESGSYEKEIGELGTSERQSLHPALREHVAEQHLDRYLAKQGYVDLLERRRAYTKKIQDLVPTDLPALVEADRQRAEEERRRRSAARSARRRSSPEKRERTWSGCASWSSPRCNEARR